MRPKEVSDRLQLDKIAKDHVWKVEPSCATTGEGIFEGLVCSTTRKTYFLITQLTPPLGMALQQRQATTGCQIDVFLRSASPSLSRYLNDLHALHYTSFWLFPAYTRFLFLRLILNVSHFLSPCNLLVPGHSDEWFFGGLFLFFLYIRHVRTGL
jgi:hypothetical protein